MSKGKGMAKGSVAGSTVVGMGKGKGKAKGTLTSTNQYNDPGELYQKH